MTVRRILDILLIAFAISVSTQTLAHGEDKPGPHGGHIRMPASFHTELLQESEGFSFKVYLSDVQFANVDNKSSDLAAKALTSSGDVDLACKKVETYFSCNGTLPSGATANELRVTAKYKDQPRATAVYKLPLKSLQ